MKISRRLARFSIALMSATVLFTAFAASAAAQTPPFTAYGSGQAPGARIAARIPGGSVCGVATVNAAGEWLLSIPTTAACAPKEGATIAFTINGAQTDQVVKWTAGGAPSDAGKGILLTLSPYIAYGIDITPGARIAAGISGRNCGVTTVDAMGQWLLRIPSTGTCAAKEGDTVTFTLNGVAAKQTIRWLAGGVPADAAKGIALTATSPSPARTGSGGLFGSDTTSMALAILMSIATFALVAGARTATRGRLLSPGEVYGCGRA